MLKKFLFGKSWFFEEFLPGDGENFIWGVLVEKEVYSGKSLFQKIDVYDTEKMGRILTLDGRVQLSTKHEFKYHEMLVHPAMLYHPNPRKVLIVGGGDGGALREILKHPVEEACMVDIDKKVVDVSKKYLPTLSAGAFSDKRSRVFHEDGIKFVKKFKNFFDVAILDSTDQFGPSTGLFGTEFYKDVALSLKSDGILSVQIGYPFDKWGLAAAKRLESIFSSSKRVRVFIESYPSGEQCFFVGSKRINLDKPNWSQLENKFKKLELKTKYYSPEIHMTSVVFPKKI